MDPDALERLLTRACEGGEGALSEALAGMRPHLLRHVELRLPRALRRRLEPEDVVQQALLEAARRFPEWCGQRTYPFRLWLRLITNQCLDEARRRHLGAEKRDARREAEPEPGRADSGALADWFAASQTAPTEAARRAELGARIRAALEQLEPLDREILALRHFEELSNEEAAFELGIEPAAASKRFVRALARLRPLLLPFGPSEDSRPR